MFDRVPIKRILVASAIAFGGGFVALGLSHSLLLDAVVLFVPLAIAVVGAGTGANPALVARWFTVYRGRAMAIAAIGVSLGGLALAPPATFLIARIGWRQALIGLGCGITPVFYALLADRFGQASFGTVNGLSVPLMMFCNRIVGKRVIDPD